MDKAVYPLKQFIRPKAMAKFSYLSSDGLKKPVC